MIKVTFKNLEKSDLAREAVFERLAGIVEKFEHLQSSRVNVTLEMENSPHQAGPDLFKVKVYVSGGRYGGIQVVKSAPSLYLALADLVDHMLEVLNRFGDKVRVKHRSRARNFSKSVAPSLIAS